MALIEYDLFQGRIDKVQIAIERLKTFEPKEGYYLAFSGGKDSVVIKALADMAKVKYDAHYNVTTIDPPELVKFIRQFHPDVIFDKPTKPFLKRLIENGFPLPQKRWCCKEYKERGGTGRFVVTGIRWAESYRRKSRKMVEHCFRDNSKKYLNVIIDWIDADVWEFIKQFNIPYCSLYDEGFRRLGCILCPMAHDRKRHLKRWPKLSRAFERAFDRLYERKRGRDSVKQWSSGKEMFVWWLSGLPKENPDQMVIFE